MEHDASTEPIKRRTCRQWLKTHHAFLVLFVFAAAVNLAVRLLNLPLNRIMELRYCRDYYLEHDPSIVGPGGDVEERLCKIAPVQKKLAWLQGFIDTSIIVCDLAVTLPFGIISDRLGRKLILILNSLATIAMFAWFLFVGKSNSIPVEAMVAAPYIALFGGGNCVLTSTVFAYLTDVAPNIETRMAYFSYLSSLSYVFALAGPILASATMAVDLWFPYYLGLGLCIGSFPILLLVPGDAHPSQDDRSPATTSEPQCDTPNEETPLLADNPRQDTTAKPSPKPSLLQKLILEVKSISQLLVGRPSFPKLIGIAVMLSIGSSNLTVFLLYLSKRYERTFAEVGYLLSVKGAANVLLLVVIIPTTVKAWIRKHPHKEVETNLYGLEMSVIFLAVGSLCLGLATKLWCAIIAIVIYGFGTATGIFILALVKSPLVSTDEHDSARDFSIVVMLRTVGELAGVPLMTAAWTSGVELGGIALGLPYFISVAFYLLALASIWHLHRTWTKNLA